MDASQKDRDARKGPRFKPPNQPSVPGYISLALALDLTNIAFQVGHTPKSTRHAMAQILQPNGDPGTASVVPLTAVSPTLPLS